MSNTKYNLFTNPLPASESHDRDRRTDGDRAWRQYLVGAANRWPTLPRVQQEQKFFGCRRDDDGTMDINRRRYDRRSEERVGVGDRLRRPKSTWLVGRNPYRILEFPAAQVNRRTGTRKREEEREEEEDMKPAKSCRSQGNEAVH